MHSSPSRKQSSSRSRKTPSLRSRDSPSLPSPEPSRSLSLGPHSSSSLDPPSLPSRERSSSPSRERPRFPPQEQRSSLSRDLPNSPPREPPSPQLTCRSGNDLQRKPSLLPAFEPLSSLPRAQKRKQPEEGFKHYPTPVPTSSTALLLSSPTSIAHPVQRSVSSISERAPLSTLPSLNVPSNGEHLLIGRSSNSSHYQISANRLISRIHVVSYFHEPSTLHTSGELVIECKGWNGAHVHCRGQVYSLAKGDSFTSDQPAAEIMLDVQDVRVIIGWPSGPQKLSLSGQSESTFTEDTSASRPVGKQEFTSSPPPFGPQSPVSLSLHDHVGSNTSTFLADNIDIPNPIATVNVYEDSDCHECLADQQSSESDSLQPVLQPKKSGFSFSSSIFSDDFSDQDEENDPKVLLGVIGETLLVDKARSCKR